MSPWKIAFSLSACLFLTPMMAQAQGQRKPPSGKPIPVVKPGPPSGTALIEALEAENIPRALALIQKGADPNAINDEQTQSALIMAAGLGDLKLVRALLERGATQKIPPEGGYSPLRAALDAESPEVAALLIERGAIVNEHDSSLDLRRPLVIAAFRGWLPLVKLLLDKGAEINHVDEDGITAVAGAAEGGQLAVLELLVNRGARIAPEIPVMHAAVAGGNVPVIRYLLEKGRTLLESVKDSTMVHVAAQGGNAEILQMTLDAGGDMEALDVNGETPLMNAARLHQPKTVALLIEKKARLNVVTRMYQTALDLAQETSFADDLDDPNRKTTIAALQKAGATSAPPSLWRAAVHDDKEQLNALLDKGEDPNLPDTWQGVPLYYALAEKLSSDSIILVKALLGKGANPNGKAPDGRSLVEVARDEVNAEAVALLRRAGAETPELELTEAVERNDETTIERSLTAGVVPEATALVYAMTRNDHHALLIRLLKNGAKVNGPTRIRGFFFSEAPNFPLHAAAMMGNVEAVRLLLDNGADPNIRKEKDDPTPLHQVGGENTDAADRTTKLLRPPVSEEKPPENPDAIDAIVRLLVEHGADVRAHHGSLAGGSVLAHLAGVASPKTLKYVMEKGAIADVNVPAGDATSTPPLTIAVRTGKVDNVRLLLQHDANPNTVERGVKDSPLLEVAAQDETPATIEIVKLLLKHGALVEAKDSLGQNALKIAQANGNFEIIKILRAAGSKATISPAAAMGRALYNGDRATVIRLLKEGFDPNGRLIGGESVLYEAAFYGEIEIVKLLLDRGANVNLKATLGMPLHAAADGGELEIVRLLLARGATVDSDDGFSGTPLTRAAEEGHVSVMQVLLKAGADPNARKSEHPGSPLINALTKGGSAATELLLKAGADPNLGNALWSALVFGDVSKVERLVRAGAKINLQNELGRTLLMDAAALGQKDLVQWLIDHKADVNLVDNRGKTALMYAMERNKSECIRLLRKAGAK